MEHRFEIFEVGFLVQRGSNGVGPAAHRVEIAFMIQRLAQIVEILLAVQGIGHIDDGNIVFRFQVIGQVAVAVRHVDVVHFHGSFGLLRSAGKHPSTFIL